MPEETGFQVTTNDASETKIINNDPPATAGNKPAAVEDAATKQGGK